MLHLQHDNHLALAVLRAADEKRAARSELHLGIDERDLDRVLLDLPEPWQAVPGAKAALRPGGIVFAHCPNVSQVQRFFDCLREVRGFGMLEVFEVLQRGWTVRGRSLRPSHRMVAHTGFITTARRILDSKFLPSLPDRPIMQEDPPIL